VARGVKIRSLGTLLPSPREFARLVETWRLEPHRAWTRHDAHARTGPRHLPAVGSNLPVSGVQGPSPAARFSACRETTKRACRKPWGARTCVASRKCALRPSIRRLLIELVQDKTWRRARGAGVLCRPRYRMQCPSPQRSKGALMQTSFACGQGFAPTPSASPPVRERRQVDDGALQWLDRITAAVPLGLLPGAIRPRCGRLGGLGIWVLAWPPSRAT
jgi:hypothetical protein